MAPIVQQHKVRRALWKSPQEAQPLRLLETKRTACANREQRKRDFNDEHVVVVVDGIMFLFSYPRLATVGGTVNGVRHTEYIQRRRGVRAPPLAILPRSTIRLGDGCDFVWMVLSLGYSGLGYPWWR